MNPVHKGCSVAIETDGRADLSLFSESQSRIIISASATKKKEILPILKKSGLYFREIGKVGGNSVIINDIINLDVKTISDSYYNSIHRLMEK